MSLDLALMLPPGYGFDGPGGPRPANPSITVTTQGTAGSRAQSSITSSGDVGTDDTTTDDAGNSCGILTGVPFASAGSGWSVTNSAFPTSTFQKDTVGATSEPTKASGGGDVSGTAGTDGVPEVSVIDLDGATAGEITISGATLAWNADAGAIESALETATGRGLSVTGSGPFTVTEDVFGDVADLSIDSHTLTK